MAQGAHSCSYKQSSVIFSFTFYCRVFLASIFASLSSMTSFQDTAFFPCSFGKAYIFSPHEKKKKLCFYRVTRKPGRKIGHVNLKGSNESARKLLWRGSYFTAHTLSSCSGVYPLPPHNHRGAVFTGAVRSCLVPSRFNPLCSRSVNTTHDPE